MGNEREPKRRWLQFRLGSLLMLMAALAVVMSVFLQPSSRQSRTVAAIERLGGTATKSFVAPQWLREIVGRDRFVRVKSIDLSETKIGDGDLKYLSGLSDLRALDLSNTNVTDAGLRFLEALPHLQVLKLNNTSVTDDALKWLRPLRHLQRVHLNSTLVTDAGLLRLEPLPRLKRIEVRDSQVTFSAVVRLFERIGLPEQDRVIAALRAVGTGTSFDPSGELVRLDIGGQLVDGDIAHLGVLTSVKQLNFGHVAHGRFRTSPITDAGAEHLRAMNALRSLDLIQTGMTDAGLRHVAALTELQSLQLPGRGITDTGMKHLRELTELRSLDVYGPNVTGAGLEHLRPLLNLRSHPPLACRSR